MSGPQSTRSGKHRSPPAVKKRTDPRLPNGFGQLHSHSPRMGPIATSGSPNIDRSAAIASQGVIMAALRQGAPRRRANRKARAWLTAYFFGASSNRTGPESIGAGIFHPLS